MSTHVGRVPSADIAVPEHDREVRFYASVLATGDAPLWRDDLMNNRGEPVIGVGARTPEYEHLPLQWMPHIQVADVGASVEHASREGATVLMHHEDDRGRSQWAVLVDPFGAAFGIIPTGAPESIDEQTPASSADSPPGVGRIVLLELSVSDPSSAVDFYQRVVGWSAREIEWEDSGRRHTDHALIAEDGVEVGRIRTRRPAEPALPPVWLIGLPVGDFAESLRRVESGGGEVVRSERGAGGVSEYAVIQDPIGARLSLVAG